MDKHKDIFSIQGIKDGDIRNKYTDKEVGPDIIFSQQEQPTLKKGISDRKTKFLFIIFCVTFLIVFIKLFSMQIVSGQEYRDRAENNRIKNEEINALRGIIYDRNGETLVKNSPNFTLYFIPSEIEEDEIIQIAGDISSIIKISEEEILSLFELSDSISNYPVIIKDYINYLEALNLKIALNNHPSVHLDTLSVRQYQKGEAFSHLLGYMGKITKDELDYYSNYSPLDYIGKVGLENWYEEDLKGVDGIQQVERDSFNKTKNVIATKEPIPGNNLILNIDAGLQEVLYDSLVSSIKSNRSTGGAAIAINPSTGAILSFISYPSYDNNLFFTGIDSEIYQELIENPQTPFVVRTTSGEYPPGSTVKPLIASAALEEKVVTQYDTILSTGGIQIDKWYFPDWKSGGHGITNVVKAIAESVNTYFYAIGGGYEEIEGLGLETITRYLESFGLNQTLGIDFPNEKDGFLPSREWKEKAKGERWYIGDTYHLAIGQGDILVTPLQVAFYTAAIANGGTLYKPFLVDKFTDINNNEVSVKSPEIINQNFISSKNISTIKRGLREAVLSGSAQSLSTLPFSSAGKTGTAQFASNKNTHAWFTCFAPYENPEIVITVLVEQGGEGHAVALPVAKAGLSWYFDNQ